MPFPEYFLLTVFPLEAVACDLGESHLRAALFSFKTSLSQPSVPWLALIYVLFWGDDSVGKGLAV